MAIKKRGFMTKLSTGDRVVEVTSRYMGVVENVSFNSIFQENEYFIRWDDGGLSMFTELEAEHKLAKDNGQGHAMTLPPGFQFKVPTSGWHNVSVNLSDLSIGSPISHDPTDKSKSCDHKWVEVGFTHTKMVCYHCDQEQK